MSNDRPVILVVDDEPQIRRFLRASFGVHDYGIVEASSAKEGLRAATTRNPDLIVLDLGLPDGDGKDLIRDVRTWTEVPIIVLSVRDDEREKVAALDLGADDYLSKPFGMDELMARVRVCLRKRDQSMTSNETSAIRVGDVSIDMASREVRKAGEVVQLTPKEFELVCLLARNTGRVITHRQLLEKIWGPAHADEVQYLRVYIAQLRQKLEANPADPEIFLTEPGVGYRAIDPTD